MDVWFETSGQCPKCRSDEGHAGRIDLRRLDGVVKVLLPLIADDSENFIERYGRRCITIDIIMTGNV